MQRRAATVVTGFALLLAITLVSGSAFGKDERSARELLAACESGDSYCEGFLGGTLTAHRIRDAHSLVVSGHQLLCIPDDLTLSQFTKQFIAYVKPREKEWGWGSSALALAALEHYHDCYK